jgi:predicted acetyltransferase
VVDRPFEAATLVVIGVIRVRHWLTKGLESEGGHIGLCDTPLHAAQAIRHAAARAGARGSEAARYQPVRVTVDANNVGSIKVIEANGGRLDGGKTDAHRRYWIHV